MSENDTLEDITIKVKNLEWMLAEIKQFRERHDRALEYCRDNLANYDGHHHTEHEAGETETCSELIDILEGTDQ